MRIPKILAKILTIVGTASLFFLASCGGGGGVITTHQTGNFSNASLTGSYVFQLRGFLASNSPTPYREIGVITADGSGNITAGADILNTIGLVGSIASTSAITGTYTVSSDGTGQMLLSSTTLGSLAQVSQISLAITMVSTSKVDLMEADVFAEGAGNAELQGSVSAPSGSFVFGLHQDVDADTGASGSEVGLMNVSSGTLTGNLDQHSPSTSNSLTFSGSLNAPSAQGIGTGTYTDSASVTINFVYCTVNSGKFIFIVTDSGGVGEGSAELQSGNVSGGLAGTYAFGTRGDDTTFFADIATVGRFTASGATISAGSLDNMNEGTPSGAVQFTGTPTTGANNPSSTGRVAITLMAGSTPTPAVFWMVSPSRAYFLFENVGSAEDGTADLQTTSSFSNSTLNGQFAMVMDGIDTTPEGVGRIGTIQFDGNGKSTVVELVNDSATGSGATNPGPLSGTYGITPGGRASVTVANGGGGLNIILYAVSGSQAYALQVDQGSNTVGTMELQPQ